MLIILMMALNVGIYQRKTLLQYLAQIFSLIIDGELVIFTNSIGDITAVDIESGLITWQLPTQSSTL